MNKIKMIAVTACSLMLWMCEARAQSPEKRFRDGLKIYLSDDSVRYVKATGLAQIWVRYNENNPGSSVYNTPQDHSFDVGLRRVRLQTMAQVTKNVFFYTQFGINSLNSLSARKTGLFFHDVTGEYNVYKGYITIGTGLSGWNGTSRFSSSGVASILAMDLPMIQETTNDVSDQFVRRYGIYAKGKIGAFDYRFSAANPFPVQNALSAVAQLPFGEVNTAYYSQKAPKLQYQGYVMWQFLEKESNQLPYMTGSYLGKKRVLNIGSGFAFQKDAMWYRDEAGDTISKPLHQFGADVFFDYYLNKEKQNGVTAYAAFLNYYFGPGYIRNVGAMSPTNGIVGIGSFNGTGNAYPLIGTGQVIYFQTGYIFRKDLLGSQGTLQPYAAASYAQYQRLSDPVRVYNIGVNWIMAGNNSKLSLDYQSRPVFVADAAGGITEASRKGQLVLQYQLAF